MGKRPGPLETGGECPFNYALIYSTNGVTRAFAIYEMACSHVSDQLAAIFLESLILYR